MTRRTILMIAATLVAVVGAGAGVWWIRSGTGTPPSIVTFTVDPAVAPSIGLAEPLDGQTEARPVGAIADPDGEVTELCLTR